MTDVSAKTSISISFESKNESTRKVVKRKGHVSKKSLFFQKRAS